MNPELKSMNSHGWQQGLPVLGKTLSHYFIVSTERFREVIKATFWIAIAIIMSLLVGQLH